MAREQFIGREFKAESVAIIEAANEIITDYQAQGFTLTLRQLYYQFVSRDLIPNTERSYKRLGSIINDARLAGLIDWESIEDRTRNLQTNLRLTSPAHGIDVIRQQYGIDMWTNQERRVEVWIEKEALAGVIDGVCNELDVPYFACRGYVSQSEQWRAYRRILGYRKKAQQSTLILHLGDHDPSGIDMTRDNADRLSLFLSTWGLEDIGVEVKRIALNRDQIDDYNPPPNPAKQTDSRFEGYLREHGDESWELDALEPAVIVQLIRDEVDDVTDTAAWNERKAALEADLAKLDEIIEGLQA